VHTRDIMKILKWDFDAPRGSNGCRRILVAESGSELAILSGWQHRAQDLLLYDGSCSGGHLRMRCPDPLRNLTAHLTAASGGWRRS
jgi:hypothetical protein